VQCSKCFLSAGANLALLLVGITLIATQVFAAAPEHSLAFLYHSKQHRQFQFSPDGQYAAYNERIGNKNKIGLYHLATKTFKKLYIKKAGYLENLFWLDDNQLLLEFAGSFYTVDIEQTFYREFLVKSSGFFWSRREASKNFRYWRFVNRLATDPDYILMASPDISGYENLYRVNIHTAEQQRVVRGRSHKVHHWVVDSEGAPRVGFRRFSSRVEILTPNKRGRFKKNAIKINGEKYKLGFKGGTLIDQRIIVYAAPKPNIIYLSENVTTDKHRMVAYDLETKTIISTIHSNPDYDVGGFFSDAVGLFLDNNGVDVAGVRYETQQRKTHWLDKTIESIQQELERAYPRHIIEIFDWTNDKNYYLAWIYSDVDPGKVVIYNAQEREQATITDFSISKVYDAFAATRHVKIQNRVGLMMDGYLSFPLGVVDPPRKLPFVVIPHGGPWARDVLGYNPDVQYFAAHGYGVLSVNYRGSAGYGRSFLLSGIRQLSSAMIDDIADGTQWLIDEQFADPEKIYLFGGSYGGYAALVSAYRYPSLYAAAVADSAPIDLLLMLESYKKNNEKFWFEYWSRAIGDPYKEQERIASESPINQLSKIEQPLLVVHGVRDPVVPIMQTKKLNDKLAENKQPNLYSKIYKKEGHGISAPANRAELIEMSLELFETGKITVWGDDALKTTPAGLDYAWSPTDTALSRTADSSGKHWFTHETAQFGVWCDIEHWEFKENNSDDAVRARLRLRGTMITAEVREEILHPPQLENAVIQWIKRTKTSTAFTTLERLEYQTLNGHPVLYVEANKRGFNQTEVLKGYFYHAKSGVISLTLSVDVQGIKEYKKLIDDMMHGFVLTEKEQLSNA